MNVYAVNIQWAGEGAPEQYSAEFQTEKRHASAWKSVLARARAGAVVTCACPGRGDKRLAIRRYDDADLFTLARYPLSGSQHASDCRFHAPNPMRSGLSGYQSGVIQECSDGVIVRLKTGLRQKPARAAADGPAAGDTPSSVGMRKTQPAMRLLGLLHFLWEDTDLNAWWPAMRDKRSQRLVNRLLEQSAGRISASLVKIDSVLLLPDFKPEGERACKNRERVLRGIDDHRRMIVIAPLMKYADERAAKMTSVLKIAGFNGIPLLNMRPMVWDWVCGRFPRAITAWKRQQMVMAIAVIVPKSGQYRGRFADVFDLALMPVTENWIPFDSMYEKRIADKLTQEGRGFVKPLRYDADESVVFPDFILRDTEEEAPLEVFGRDDEAYAARRSEKIAYYEAEYGTGRWWCWNAAADPEGLNIPPFPARFDR